ncbi:MAG: alanine racemase [Spirochaetota bacterium]
MRATRAEISLPNLYHNLAHFRACLQPRVRLCLAVKGNAYGHGLSEISRRAAADSHVDSYAVATVEEGIALRQAGIRQAILLLSAHLKEEIPLLCQWELEPLISHSHYLSDYQREAARHKTTLRLHLKIDTGMSRAGALPAVAPAIAGAIQRLDALKLNGICTHFASADEENPDQTQAQIQCFNQVLSTLREQNIPLPCIHAANSAATLRYPETHFDMVRIGIGAYGYSCETLRPVMTLKSKIGLIKPVPRGAKVSYGGTWTAPRDSLLALLPIGYADGYSRLLSNQGQVLLQGEPCPLVGRVSMDQIVIDLTAWAAKRAVQREQLYEQDIELFGSRITAQDIARQVHTIPYEILTSISARVPRVYLDNADE